MFHKKRKWLRKQGWQTQLSHRNCTRHMTMWGKLEHYCQAHHVHEMVVMTTGLLGLTEILSGFKIIGFVLGLFI